MKLKNFSLCFFVSSFLLFSACKESAETAIPRLVKQLSSPVQRERSQAALELARYGKEAKDAVPALIETLKDPNGGVKSNAAFALRSIDTQEARKALKQ